MRFITFCFAPENKYAVLKSRLIFARRLLRRKIVVMIYFDKLI